MPPSRQQHVQISRLLHNSEDVLHSLLPPPRFQHLAQSQKTYIHDRVLPDRLFRLADSNFIVRMLFYEAY